MSIDLADGNLAPGDVELREVLTLRDRFGRPFRELVMDAEGIALGPEGTLLVSSEGNVERNVAPSLREFDREGAELRELPIPRKFRPRRGQPFGVRHNQAFESLTVTPDGRRLFTATENAIYQDGPAADVGVPTTVRVIEYDLQGGEPAAEYALAVEPVAVAPVTGDAFRVNGLVELLALADSELIALERSFSMGMGNSIRLFAVSLEGAADIRDRKALKKRRRRSVATASKTLLLDLEELGLGLDNVEGLTFGPDLPDGRRTLVLVSDNNFSSRQKTQFLAFALDFETVGVAAIQGRAHRSPLEGQWVRGVRGVVTALDRSANGPGFWLQDPEGDGDPASAEGVYVRWPDEVEVGDAVSVSGRVEEVGMAGGLTVTRIAARAVERLAPAAARPAPRLLGEGGLRIPTRTIDDDSLELFDPESDAIDFYESLEGMLVEVRSPPVVGPTDRFGGTWILAQGVGAETPRTGRGGLLLRPPNAHPSRLQVVPGLQEDPPGAAVGDRFEGAILGVLDYAFGNFRLLATAPLPPLHRAGAAPQSAALRGEGDRLTVATFNVENLSPASGPEKLERLAQDIVLRLGSPDLLALQEIQDDSGPMDDGTVIADRTLSSLIEAVAAAGGPDYEFRQIDPEDGSDGGQPGGNIRVAFLFRPERLQVVDRGNAGPAEPNAVEPGPEGPRLRLSPGRVAPLEAAFLEDPETGFEASRKPLAAEFLFASRRLVLINVHLRSKRGDDRLFGSRQPPGLHSEGQRIAQARALADFVAPFLSGRPPVGVVLLGDFNELEFRPPMRLLADRGLVNLIERVPAPDRYTYVFEGNSEVLDHVLVSPALAATAEVEIVHLNADFAAPRRSSDHDPVLVRLDLSN